MKTKPWTEAHQREAYARKYELAAKAARGQLDGLSALVSSSAATEGNFRAALNFVGFDPARVDREVRRVRALAEGRLVREERWGVRYHSHDLAATFPRATKKEATDEIRRNGGLGHVVRFTSIRRAR